MEKLGTYKPSYNPVIDIYCELREQYERITIEFKESNYSYEISTAQGGAKKAPIVATLETLRKDILAYSDRLCLNPKSLESITIEKEKGSKLGSILQSLE